ncbi:tetratricopeptide repeat protein [Dyella tabacisoli]|uniref:Tetratricopeptide repeat protein n=1 Tax=Dyella tabacisoli TaxID=2282381 RepID=A0A369UPU8_9GAMM|nr:hypothetical protein [Dyella tabacisoli]RDD82497.1 hypothetical protein DVJ77_06020 [Dyella tabacisoli]
MKLLHTKYATTFWLVAALLLTFALYWPGLSGGWLFDDYPNIVDNKGVQPVDTRLPTLITAALSSPSSDFKRPLASLSFALNYRAAGLDPYWMKLTNLLIHLLNGLLVFFLARGLLLSLPIIGDAANETSTSESLARRVTVIAILIATAWMLLPINLTAVLYVVQRMESMANLFVLLGLVGYVAGRRRMLAAGTGAAISSTRGFVLCVISITVPTALGLLAKETAVMLPLYAFLIEWALYRSARPQEVAATVTTSRRDWRIWILFLVVLLLPMLVGLAWIVPRVLHPDSWVTREFTLGTRLLSETRIVLDYIVWTLLPTTHALSFYHDDFVISTGLLTPWATLASLLGLIALAVLTVWLRRRAPLAALGLAMFLGSQLLTATILPLDLIYEHRNYFASFGLVLALISLLLGSAHAVKDPAFAAAPLPYALPRYALLAALLFAWAMQTALAAFIWGVPLRLARDLAARAPESPRAQYDLGRSYLVYSQYDPNSSFTPLAYEALEKAASLPRSSILPQQALIFMNARMHLPAKDAWWDSLIAKLKARPSGVQDDSSMAVLTKCVISDHCDLPKERMLAAFQAALAHPNPSSRLQAMYGQYAWDVLKDKALGERMLAGAVATEPSEPTYHITLIQMLAESGHKADALTALQKLKRMNLGGRLDDAIRELSALPQLQ